MAGAGASTPTMLGSATPLHGLATNHMHPASGTGRPHTLRTLSEQVCSSQPPRHVRNLASCASCEAHVACFPYFASACCCTHGAVFSQEVVMLARFVLLRVIWCLTISRHPCRERPR